MTPVLYLNKDNNIHKKKALNFRKSYKRTLTMLWTDNAFNNQDYEISLKNIPIHLSQSYLNTECFIWTYLHFKT